MSTLHVSIDDATSLAELVERLALGDEVSLERRDEPLARLVPAPRPQPYIGLYGNHPYQVRNRPEPRLPDLAPEDYTD